MSVRIIQSANADFISTSLLAHLEQARDQHQHPVCLVPSFEDTDDLKMSLAIGFGVEVFALGTYLENMWRMWGDVRALATSVQRYIYMEKAIHKAELELSPGAIRFASAVARQTMGYVLTDPLDESEVQNLEEGYSKLYKAYGYYAQMLEDDGYIEPSYAEVLLPAYMHEKEAHLPELFVVGFSHLEPEHLAFIAEYARFGSVNIVLNMQDNPSFDLERETQEHMQEVLKRRPRC